ncbi:MAG: MBL fold metallo-hydrolase [Roseburia sp.]|nr:MBL fold metallo-hydrolase [Roseburia sp.]MCM1096827.1 MBL fold metallo-hydrolase [Ruminococcus flavefaciens]
MGVSLSVWGVRGSLPVADRQFLEYGGNTSCFCLDYGEGLLCLDAGSGLIGRLPERTGRVDILIGHAHMDHILGLYSLSGLEGTEVHLYGGAQEGVSFRKQLETAIGRPYWPLGLADIEDRVEIHEIEAGEVFSLAGKERGPRISALRGNHPGGCLLYRAKIGEASVTYALDCEMNEEMVSSLTEFARGTSLLIWDASFTRGDKRPGWGHSTWEEGLALGKAAGAGRILMTHYFGSYTDSFLREQQRLAEAESSSCLFAREGMVIEL